MFYVRILFVQPYLLPVTTDMTLYYVSYRYTVHARMHTHSHYRTVGFISFMSCTVVKYSKFLAFTVSFDGQAC